MYRAIASSMSVGLFRSARWARSVRSLVIPLIVFLLLPLRSRCRARAWIFGICSVKWHVLLCNGIVLLEIPATVGIVGVLLAPWLAALGAIAALATNCRIVVERRE